MNEGTNKSERKRPRAASSTEDDDRDTRLEALEEQVASLQAEADALKQRIAQHYE